VSPTGDAPPTASSSYRTRRGILFALTPGRVVLLDVPADRYFCLPEDLDLAFRALAAGKDPDVLPQAVEQLLREDVITMAPEGVPILAAAPPAPRVELPASSAHPVSAIAAVTRSMLLASFEERFLSLERRLLRLKVPGDDAASDASLEVEAARRFAAARTMLPFRRKCLRDSFALLHFLGRGRGVAGARLVVGVTMDPFGAHAWVQYGETVLNDRVDRVTAFTPILVA